MLNFRGIIYVFLLDHPPFVSRLPSFSGILLPQGSMLNLVMGFSAGSWKVRKETKKQVTQHHDETQENHGKSTHLINLVNFFWGGSKKIEVPRVGNSAVVAAFRSCIFENNGRAGWSGM